MSSTTAAVPNQPTKTESARFSWQPLGLVGAALAMAALFFAMMLRSSDGHLSPPLDDTLIYFQYAKQIAHGQVFVYIDGDPRTSGSTSFLYPFVLAAGYLAGFRDDRLVLFGLVLAACFLMTAALLTHAIARRLMDAGPAWTAGLLVVVNGWLAWTAFSMMESALHAVALLAAVLLFLRAASSRRDLLAFAAILAFLPFVRPELTLLAVIIGGWWAFASFFQPRQLSWFERLLPLACAGAGAAIYFGLMTALTGDPRSDTYIAKSVLANEYTTTSFKIRMIRENFFDHLQFAFEFFGPSYVWVLAAALAALGATAFFVDDWRERSPTARSLIPLLFVAGVLTASLPFGSYIHFHRWAAPYEPLVVLLVVRGVVTLLAVTPFRIEFGWPVAAVMVVAAAVPAVQAADEYGKNTSDIYFQQTQAAFWLRDNTPPDAVIGLNDAGAMPYYSRRRAYDIIGLVTQDAAEAFAAGPASTYEQIEALPPEDRPDYYAIYPIAMRFAEPDIGFVRQIKVFALESPTIAGAPWKIIYEPDNTLLGAGDAPVEVPSFAPGWRVVDRLDVAHLASEEEHGYRFLPPLAGVRPPQVLFNHTYTGDARRMIDGARVSAGESFQLDAEAGKPFVVLLRTSNEAPVNLLAEGDGASGTVQLPASPDNWRDIAVARGDTTDETVDLTLMSSQHQAYAAYTYWLLQP